MSLSKSAQAVNNITLLPLE